MKYEDAVKYYSVYFFRRSSLQDRAADPERDAREQEREDEEKEKKVEGDDEETLQKAREWDDWKDGMIIYICIKIQSCEKHLEITSYHSIVECSLSL